MEAHIPSRQNCLPVEIPFSLLSLFVLVWLCWMYLVKIKPPLAEKILYSVCCRPPPNPSVQSYIRHHGLHLKSSTSTSRNTIETSLPTPIMTPVAQSHNLKCARTHKRASRGLDRAVTNESQSGFGTAGQTALWWQWNNHVYLLPSF